MQGEIIASLPKNMFNDIVNLVARGDSVRGTIYQVVDHIETNIKRLISGDVNLSELTMTKSVRELNSYKVNQPHVVMARRLVQKGINVPAGTRLEFVYVKDGRTQGEKMKTPDEVQNSTEIDYLFYIEKQLITQIDDILEVIGISGFIYRRYVNVLINM